MLVNLLIIALPALLIATILMFINISSLKKELRNTMGLNTLAEDTIEDQTKQINELNDKISTDITQAENQQIDEN